MSQAVRPDLFPNNHKSNHHARSEDRVWLHWSIERWAECTARLIEDARAKKSQAALAKEI